MSDLTQGLFGSFSAYVISECRDEYGDRFRPAKRPEGLDDAGQKPFAGKPQQRLEHLFRLPGGQCAGGRVLDGVFSETDDRIRNALLKGQVFQQDGPGAEPGEGLDGPLPGLEDVRGPAVDQIIPERLYGPFAAGHQLFHDAVAAMEILQSLNEPMYLYAHICLTCP